MSDWPTVADLATFLGDTITTDQTTHAQSALDAAIAAVKSEAHQEIEFVADDQVHLRGAWEPELYLPQRPVVGVSAVSIVHPFAAEQVLAAGSFDWTRHGQLLLRSPGAFGWGGPNAVVKPIYSHGYVVIPNDLKGIVNAVAARTYLNPEGTKSQQSADHSATYTVATATLLSEERKIVRRYRPR